MFSTFDRSARSVRLLRLILGLLYLFQFRADIIPHFKHFYGNWSFTVHKNNKQVCTIAVITTSSHSGNFLVSLIIDTYKNNNRNCHWRVFAFRNNSIRHNNSVTQPSSLLTKSILTLFFVRLMQYTFHLFILIIFHHSAPRAFHPDA